LSAPNPSALDDFEDAAVPVEAVVAGIAVGLEDAELAKAVDRIAVGLVGLAVSELGGGNGKDREGDQVIGNLDGETSAWKRATAPTSPSRGDAHRRPTPPPPVQRTRPTAPTHR